MSVFALNTHCRIERDASRRAKFPERRLGRHVPRGSARARTGSGARRLPRDPRQRGRPAVRRQLGRVAADAARASVPRARLALHLSGTDPRSNHRGDRSRHAERHRDLEHFLSTYAQERTIWLDGRPHPPEEAPHTWMGFSTGEWQGRVLTVDTTHIKQGWHRRNGVPMSAKATMTEYFFRHGNVLTQLSITEDPIFLVRAAGQDHEPAAGRQRHPISTRRGCSARPTTKCRDAIPPTCRTTWSARTRI